MRLGARIRPNKMELKLLGLLLKNGFPYRYIGDGQVVIGGKCPDFLNTAGQQKLIESFGDYWHTRPGSKEKDKERLKVFSDYGYQTLVIWEHELEDRRALLEKIAAFEEN